MATGQLFDHYLAQAQSRSRSDSANSSSFSVSTTSLPPPPRHHRKVTSPPPVVANSSRSSPLPLVQKPSSRNAFADPEASGSFPRAEQITEGEPLQRPRPLGQPIYRAHHHLSTYSDSLSSDNSYSNLFYKPERDNGSPPLTQSDGNRDSQALSFDDEVSVEDYSALLYPDLQSAHGHPHSPLPSIDIHGPPLRRRVSSFTSHDGPESPVEFAGLGNLSSSVPQNSDEPLHEPSTIDRLLGIEPSLSSDRDKGLAFDTGRRESFIDMDTDAVSTNATSTPEPSLNAALRSKASLPDEMPTFTALRVTPNKTLGDYVAMLEIVDGREFDPESTSPKGSRQVLVDGSDKPRIATPDISVELGSTGRPSTTNLLDQKERAELVRKNRKIVQVLGPGATPAAQTHMRAGASSPSNMDHLGYRRDYVHRSTQSDALAFGEHRYDNATDGRRQDQPIKSQVAHKLSWSALDQDTIFLSANGRRHSSPMSPTLITPANDTTRDADVASMSSLGSIIKPANGNGGRGNSSRSNSPTSFIELSDDDGVKTPKRRRSVDLPEPQEHELGNGNLGNVSRPIPSDLPESIRASTPSLDDFQTEYSVSRRKWGGSVTPLRAKPSIASSLSRSDNDVRRVDHWRGDPKDEWELERQRKRQQLAKIHRYLGSKVPAELVVGYSSSTVQPIAPVHVTPKGQDLQAEKKRRRSSSATMYPSWDHPSTRPSSGQTSTDGLSSAERMQKMKSAAKIEQIFGEPPPRRLSLSLTRPSEKARDDVYLPQPDSGLHEDRVTSSKGYKAKSPFGKRPSTAGSSRPSTTQSTTGLMSSYNKDIEREKRQRAKGIESQETQVMEVDRSPYPIGTALGSPWDDQYDDVIDISPLPTSVYGSKAPVQPGVPTSRQFHDYRNSLNTLHRILDQDDRQSLNELHAVLDSDEEEDEVHANGYHSSSPHGDADRHRPPLQSPTEHQHKTIQPRMSLASINTVATDSTYATLTPKPMDFQARRKRAAKLTQFFGATYRDLFGEVLDRIERGMLEEVALGKMSQEEMMLLVQQLNRLKRRHSQLA